VSRPRDASLSEYGDRRAARTHVRTKDEPIEVWLESRAEECRDLAMQARLSTGYTSVHSSSRPPLGSPDVYCEPRRTPWVHGAAQRHGRRSLRIARLSQAVAHRAGWRSNVARCATRLVLTRGTGWCRTSRAAPLRLVLTRSGAGRGGAGRGGAGHAARQGAAVESSRGATATPGRRSGRRQAAVDRSRLWACRLR
jgi:hypothetical protein